MTYYDEASGERTELSVRSLANWVAKTHFLLTDELGLGVGSRAYLALPAHWISVPAVLGCLTAGLALDVRPVARRRRVHDRRGPDGVPTCMRSTRRAAAVGWGATRRRTATSDYVAAVRPQADAWGRCACAAGPSDECVDGRTRARGRRGQSRSPAGARVLSTRDWTTLDDVVDTLLAPVVAGGSVVYVRNAVAGRGRAPRRTQERATVLLT